MNNLKRYYNQNRKKIWGIIIIIAFVFALLQVANGIARSNNNKRIEQAKIQLENSKNNAENEYSDNNNLTQSNNQATTTNDKISTIEQFIEYCNNKDLESAYNMLTEKCKEEMFSNIETFENIYYNSTFENISKVATIEKWANNTYIVKITENPLSTGKIATTKEEQKIDYITVVQDEDNNYKLNINSYIGYKEISKTKEIDGIKIEILGRHTYRDYETYEIKVTNNSDENVTIDTLDNPDSIYIEDTKGVKYSSYKSELSSEMLNISSGHAKKIDIKFFSTYVDTKRIKQIVFADFRINNNKSTISVVF